MGYFIVTGASRGIGLETVRVLLNEGHRVLTLSRSAVKLQHERLDLLQSCSLDLSANDFSEVEKAIADWPRVDGLIHNAGAFLNKPFARPFDILSKARPVLTTIDPGTGLIRGLLSKQNDFWYLDWNPFIVMRILNLQSSNIILIEKRYYSRVKVFHTIQRCPVCPSCVRFLAWRIKIYSKKASMPRHNVI